MAQAVSAETKWWSGGKSPFNIEYGKLMMWYFLMSDAFTFGAFLISYGTIRFASLMPYSTHSRVWAMVIHYCLSA
jgi:cytochrome c oxidase subunit III